MARINVDDDVESRPEYRKLLRLLGGDDDRALGMLVRFWRHAQKLWGQGELVSAADMETWGWQPLIESRWAIARDGGGFYAIGSEDRFAWYRQRCQAAKKGGREELPKETEVYAPIRPVKREKTEPSKTQVPIPPVNPLTLSLTLSPKKEKTIGQEFADANPTPPAEPLILKELRDTFTDPTLASVSKAVQEGWVATFADTDWIRTELKKAITYTRANPRKTPKSARGWSAFLTGWLNRSWEWRRKREPAGCTINTTPLDPNTLEAIS